MRRSKLPLTALRAFESAGRHASFKKAAVELAVSEAAISRQVRDLEHLIGSQLFFREHRAVRLTARGKQLLGQLTPSLDAIDAALEGVMQHNAPQIVSVSVEPTFATLFLIPRLTEFLAAHGDVEVNIEASEVVTELDNEGTRLSIRHSTDQHSWPGTETRHLFDVQLTPMLAPTHNRLKVTSDVLRFKLLRDEAGDAWQKWLAAAGIGGAPTWGPVYSNSAIAIQGAQLGQGVALGSRKLAAHLLMAKNLEDPIDREVPYGAYWLVAQEFEKLTRAEAAFCKWISKEVSNH